MNEYGRRALEHWQRSKPRDLAAIPDTEDYFSTLGETIADQVQDLSDRLAGPDRPGEDYLAKLGRLAAAKQQAEELVLAELVFSPAESTETDPEDPDDDRTEQIRLRAFQRETLLRQQETDQVPNDPDRRPPIA